MKKYLTLAILLISQAVQAFDSANIHVKINGGVQDNRYFLCIPDIGCLSLLAGQKGKVFPVLHPFQMNSMFITDASQSFRLSPQGLPASCNVDVQPNQTITIAGHLTKERYNVIKVNDLKCSIKNTSSQSS